MKVRPGDVFEVDIEGTTFRVKVTSVAEAIAIEQQLADAIERRSGHLAVRLDIAQRFVVSCSDGWDIEELGEQVTPDVLDKLAAAVIRGNSPTDDDLKN